MLFYRDYKIFSGGHMKVFDYFNHTNLSEEFVAEIYVTRDSRVDHPWREQVGLVDQYSPNEADALFIAGMDWEVLGMYPRIEERIPVINLIQGVRHASPDQQLYQFLTRRAIRICVSDEVAQAIKSTGICNGPIFTIPNGIELSLLPERRKDPVTDVFISGYKQPLLAKEIAIRLHRRGFSVDCLVVPTARHIFLARMSKAQTVILLPHPEEGFYLPALEAMAMGLNVICPDCVGNRAFCVDEMTALVPRYDPADIEEAALRLTRSSTLAERIRRGALEVSNKFDIISERAAYHRVLSTLF